MELKISPPKKKWAKDHDSYLVGEPLNYPAWIYDDYRKKLNKLVSRMTKDVKKQVLELFKEYHLTTDASITDESKRLLNKLNSKWEKIFKDLSLGLATSFVNTVKKASARSLKTSVDKLSGKITLGTSFIPKELKPKISSLIEENVNLIKSIPEQYLTSITTVVMQSITTGQGLKQLTQKIEKYHGTTSNRAKNIAKDQTNKAYNTINRERMIDAGFKKFRWIHSHGGLKPRKDHIAMNGKVYSFDRLPIIDKKTGERGIPGQAINCGCTMTPVYEYA
jgi:SPP1 gp7 family putative phage head morphogenesis protein